MVACRAGSGDRLVRQMIEGDGRRLCVDAVDPKGVRLSTDQTLNIFEPFDGISLLEIVTAGTQHGAGILLRADPLQVAGDTRSVGGICQ